ncbi:MAG: S8 family peptidase [Bdellovibrionales bacterium]
MVVPKNFVLKLTACAFLLLSAVGCAKTKTSETVFPKVTTECDDQSLKGRYVVRWVDGHVTLYKGQDREQVLRDLVDQNLQHLDLVEPDYRVTLPKAAGDLPTAVTTAPDNWGPARVNADQAWQQGYRGDGITVAVIDSGVDISHDQLRSQVARNTGEIANNRIDDDGNGYVDDVNGFDFTIDQPTIRDNGEHGTHVSGIIAAQHDDNVAGAQDHVQGIAPEAKILPLAFIDSSGSGSLFNAMRAIDYAAERGAQVINASWGGASCSSIMRDQIGGLYAKKVIFVAAAGNSGLNIDQFPEYPAAFNLLSQLTIGATGGFEARAQFSNYGDQGVHLFAPGVDIVSTLPDQSVGPMSGTSMATPMVAGAIAVLLSARPLAGVDQLRQALYQSARIDRTYRNASRGRMDLGAAVARLLLQ